MNYQSELEKILARESEHGKSVLLHSCCAPRSSYVLTYLRQYFKVTVFYFNPNITADEEYYKRVEEQKRLIAELNKENDGYQIQCIEGDYEPKSFLETVWKYSQLLWICAYKVWKSIQYVCAENYGSIQKLLHKEPGYNLPAPYPQDLLPFLELPAHDWNGQ